MASPERGLIISQNTEEYDPDFNGIKGCDLVDLKDNLLVRRLIRHSKSFGTTYVSSSASSIDNRTKYIGQTSNQTLVDSIDKCENYDSRFNGARSKLLVLNDKLVAYERQMEEQSRLRRQLEEAKLVNINDTLNKLKNAIPIESKRRMETIKALHGIFESQIAAVKEKVETVFDQKIDQLESVIQSLSERIETLQQYVNDSKSKYINTIESNCILLEKNLANVQSSFESEKISRQEREEHIMKKMSEIELSNDAVILNEIQNITSTYQTLKSEIVDLKNSKLESDKKLNSEVYDEIAKIENSLVLESRARENADEDIVQALHSLSKVLENYSSYRPIGNQNEKKLI